MLWEKKNKGYFYTSFFRLYSSNLTENIIIANKKLVNMKAHWDSIGNNSMAHLWVCRHGPERREIQTGSFHGSGYLVGRNEKFEILLVIWWWFWKLHIQNWKLNIIRVYSSCKYTQLWTLIKCCMIFFSSSSYCEN